MADFSRFGGEDADWAGYMAANPQPLPRSNLTPVQLRELTNAGREANSQHILKSLGVAVKTLDFLCPTSDDQEIPVRVYRALSSPSDVSLPVFIFYHGGGFCFGTLSSEDGFCSWVAEKVGIIVVHVCYRHTPEWKWPAQREDSFNSLNWVFDNISLIGGDADKVLVGGRSSGSNLSAGIALRDKETHGKSRIRGLILDLPHVCHTDAFPKESITPGKWSYEENVNAPILPLSRIKFFNELLAVDDPTDKYYSTLLASDNELAGMPPTQFLVAGRDPLRDEALLFEKKLKQAGVKTRLNIYPGVPHGFRRYGELKMSMQYDKDLLAALEWLLE